MFAHAFASQKMMLSFPLKTISFNRMPVGMMFALLQSETDYSAGNNINSFIEDTMVCDMPQRGGFPSWSVSLLFRENSFASLPNGLSAFDLSCSFAA
jgi:hypothetical protein